MNTIISHIILIGIVVAADDTGLKVRWTSKGTCLDNRGGEDGTYFQWKDCSTNDDSMFYKYDAELQQLQNVNSGLCLDDSGSISLVNHIFISRECDPDSINQQFIPYSDNIYSDDYVLLKNVNKNLCVDDYSDDSTNFPGYWYCEISNDNQLIEFVYNTPTLPPVEVDDEEKSISTDEEGNTATTEDTDAESSDSQDSGTDISEDPSIPTFEPTSEPTSEPTVGIESKLSPPLRTKRTRETSTPIRKKNTKASFRCR